MVDGPAREPVESLRIGKKQPEHQYGETGAKLSPEIPWNLSRKLLRRTHQNDLEHLFGMSFGNAAAHDCAVGMSHKTKLLDALFGKNLDDEI